jgi:glycosyltransferase involved in cell wall biosynthesis
VKTLLSINNYFYRRGGAETVFFEHNALLAAGGWNIVPFAMRHAENFPSDWDKYFVSEIELGQKYSLQKKLRMVPKIIYSTEARRNLAGLIDESRPDIAHAHNVYHHLSPSIFSLLKKRGIPVVLTLHDLKIACPAYKMLTHDGVCERCKHGQLWNVAKHRCVKNSLTLSALVMAETYVQTLLGCYRDHVDRFIVPSRFYVEKFVEWGWPREKFTYIPNFVEAGADPPGRAAAGGAFLFAGRLSNEKGVATFVRAVAQSELQGWIVGAGPEEAALQELATQLGADITFFGYRTGIELTQLIRDARAVVVPSEWYENAPLSVLEAYALHKPVIGARIGGIPELVREAHTGTLFESGNVDDLAEALQRFARMSDHAVVQLGRNGAHWVRTEFSAASYRSKLLALYQEMGVAI